MSIGPVDIEFVIKGDVEAKLKDVGATVKGEGTAMERQLQRLTQSATEAFTGLSGSAQVQAVAMQRVSLALGANAKAMEEVKAKYAEGAISSKQYSEAMAKLATEHDTLQSQKAKLAKEVQREIDNNQLISGSINELRQKLSSLKESYENLSATERNSDIGKQMQASIKELTEELGNAEAANRGFIDQVTGMPGPIGAAATSIQGMTKAAMRFIATPIGAVIAAISAALMALTSWFRRSEEGQNALAKASGYFKQIMDSLLDVVDKVGEYLFKAFTRPKEALKDLVDFMKGQVIYRFEAIGKMAGAIGKMFAGEWKEGFAEMGNAVMQFQTGIDDAGYKMAAWANDTVEKTKQRADIEDKLFKLRVEERKVQEQIAESQNRIAELRFKARDESNNLSDKQRLDLLKEAGALIEENYKKEIDIATRRRDLVKAQKELSNSTVEDNEEVSRLNVSISQLKARQADEQRELLRQSNTLGRQLAQAAIAGVEAIQKELEQLNKDILNAGDDQRADIALRIVKLQKELQVRMDIADAALLAARNAAGGTSNVPTQMEPVKNRAQEIFAAVRKEVAANAIEMDKLNQKIAEGERRAKALQKAWDDEDFTRFVDASQEVLGITGAIVANHREILGLNEEQARALDKGFQMMSGFADLAAGNYMSGIYKLVDSALSLFVSVPEAMNVHFEQLQERISETMQSLERASRVMQQIGSGNMNVLFNKLYLNLKLVAAEADKLNKATANVSFGSWFDAINQLWGNEGISETISRMRADIDELSKKLAFGNLNNAQRAAIEAVLDSYTELIQTVDNITQDITGTTVRTLGDGLVEAFLMGEDAAAHWGQSVNDIIKNVIVKQLSAQLLQAPLQKAIDNLMANMQDGLEPWEAVLSTAEFERIFADAKPAIEAVKQQLETMGIVFGDQADRDINGISGAIRGITEESAGIIAGQLMGVRVDIKQIMITHARAIETADLALAYHAEIAANTRHNVKLNDIDSRLEEMNRYLKGLI